MAAVNEGKVGLLLKALFMGARFDTVIICYIFLIPVVVLGILFVINLLKLVILKIAYIWITVLMIVSFFACSADIPFYRQFSVRLNDTVFGWMSDFSFIVRMILSDFKIIGFLLLFFAVAFLYIKIIIRIYRYNCKILFNKEVRPLRFPQRILYYLPLFLILWGTLFLGMRGRISKKSPIRTGTAFFSTYPFINQLGLNPVFTLLRSCLDSADPSNKHIHKIDDESALTICASMYHADPDLKRISPIAREQKIFDQFKSRNLVIIIMESMSASKMQHFGNDRDITPFLDSLLLKSYSFDNIYSTGKHTYNGVYGTLFAHPSLMKRHPMKTSSAMMSGISNVLQKNNYQTIYFTTHDEQFDNMAGFLSQNGFQTIIGQKDYPAKEVKSALGVPDEYMFRYSIEKLNTLSKNDKPFFAAFLTSSDHSPYVIPENIGFVSNKTKVEEQIIEYADWSLKKFMEYASKQDWFNNTVFVFVADHGASYGNNLYDVTLTYHHTPFIIYASGVQPVSYPQIGTQMDVFPTILSQMGIPFINNTFGIDLLHENHDYIVFSSDEKLVCMNDSLLYVYRDGGLESLYYYKKGDTKDYANELKQYAEKMKEAAFAVVQTSQWMIENNKAKSDR